MLDSPSISMASYSALEFKKASAAMNDTSNANLMLKPFFWGCISLSTTGSTAAGSPASALPASDFILFSVGVSQTETFEIETFLKRMQLTDERITAFDATGFNWTSQEYVTRSFDERINDLEYYKQTHGHVNVKTYEENCLGQFCANVGYA
jgi:hypothetical protein